MVRVNRVRRIIRKIDPWTVLKVTLVLNFVVALTVVLGFSIMWVLLVNAGVPQGLEDIARRLALLDQDASLVGNIEPLFTGLVSLAAVYMLTQTAIATVGAFFYNLVSDLVGGIEVVVLEETHLDAPAKPKKVKQNTKQEEKETVLMSMIKTIKKVRTEATLEKQPSRSDLPRPDVPRNIEEPTLMDALKNTENEEDDSF
tara:strand:+ start:100 stop:699 length:600 start_codon:yes stop_codon:yes gene_type:complete